MNLYEYQSKNLLKKYNLPIVQGKVCSNINEVKHYIANHEGPWAMKCQIHSGGRGKSGGICITPFAEDVFSFCKKWFGNYLITYQTTSIGELVTSILIEPAVKILKELYLGVLIDRDSSQIVCIVSKKGGINIEILSEETPEFIHKIIINPITGIYPYQGRILAHKLGLSKIEINQFSEIIVNITRMFIEKDLMLVEINPLAIIANNTFVCIDVKTIIDDNAIFRQSELLKICYNNTIIDDTISINQSECTTNYVPLDGGNIGCIVNGAGLAMATMDLIKEFGGVPANFLDIGGNIKQGYIIKSLNMLLNNKKIKAILINIFGGIVCCELIADGIISALSLRASHVPIIVRLAGNNAKLGLDKIINKNFNIITTDNLIYAIQCVVSSAK